MSPPPAGLGGDWPCEDLADLFGPAPAAAPAGAEQEVAGMGVSTPPATTIAAASDAAAAAGGGGPAANQQQGGTTPLPLAAAADAGNGEEDMEVDMEVTPGSGSAELAQRGGLVGAAPVVSRCSSHFLLRSFALQQAAPHEAAGHP